MTAKRYYDSTNILVDQGYVFVLLPQKSKDVYEGCIKSAAHSLGLRCESILELVRPGDVLVDILERIKKAEILIFDITDFTPNVMLELGVALAIKDEDKIIVIRKSSEAEIQKKLPFNIYYHRISYSYTPNTLDELRDILIDVMRDINRRGSVQNNPIKSLEVRKLMNSATNAIEQKDWITAEVLFESMNDKEPENWYICNQWGVMFRSKNEFETARSKFQKALDYTKYEEERAYVYIELALLYNMNHQSNVAIDWLKKAEKADNKNRYLYIVWAEIYDGLKDYRKALSRINYALAELDPNDLGCQLRYEYYHNKIINPDFKISFDEYRKNKLKDEGEGKPRVKGGSISMANRSGGSAPRLPWTATWEELERDYLGRIVEGTVAGIRYNMGVFVTLSRDFSGLIFRKDLEPDFEDRYSINQKIIVKIRDATIDARNGKVKISLSLYDGSFETVSEEQFDKFYKNAEVDSHQMDKFIGQMLKYPQPIKKYEVRKLMSNAIQAIKQEDWRTAEALFKNMNEAEPNNWYIHNQWGLMYQIKNEFEHALEKFQEALDYTQKKEDRAYIYIEHALLYQMNRKTNEAEYWLKEAEKADSNNKYLYIVWAELYEESQDYRNAQVKINKILTQIDPNDLECQLRYEYYHRKIIRPDFNLSFGEYKRNREKFEDEEENPRLEMYLSKLSIDPENLDLLNRIKGIFNNLGKKEEAEKINDRIELLAEEKLQECLSGLSSEPENLKLLNEAKALYLELSEKEEAAKIEERIRHIADKKEFLYNLRRNIVLQQMKLNHLKFFGDFTWNLQPRMNVLLGRNGYGKSHLLRILVALLQKKDEMTSGLFWNDRKQPFAKIIVEREKKQEIINRDPTRVFRESIGRVPVLAIPDLRLLDKSRTIINIPAEEKDEDLGRYWSSHFLHQQPIEELIRNFLYQLCITYLEKGQSFDLSLFKLIRNVFNRLSGNYFEFTNIESTSRAGFKIHVVTEGSQTPIPLQRASQGTLSVISIFGLIYNYLEDVFPEVPESDLLNKPAIVVIDELDAHLHPSWQQKIVGLLRNSFPNIQFIVTAHSPLVVAGCKEGEVAVLRKEEDGFVVKAFDQDFIGDEAKELYDKVFEIEEKDDSYLYYTALYPFRDDIEEEIKALENEMTNNKSPSPDLEQRLKQLYDELYYAKKAHEKYVKRQEFSRVVSENRKLKARLKALEKQE